MENSREPETAYEMSNASSPSEQLLVCRIRDACLIFQRVDETKSDFMESESKKDQQICHVLQPAVMQYPEKVHECALCCLYNSIYIWC